MNPVESCEQIDSCVQILPEPSIDITEETTSSDPSMSKKQDNSKRKTRGVDSDGFVVRQWKKFKTMPEFCESKLNQMLSFRNELTSSGLLKETLGRHKEISVEVITKVSDYEKHIYKLVLDNQICNLLESVDYFKVKAHEDCCEAVIQKMLEDPLLICEKTRNHFAEWLKERKYRVTGTTAYGLYTYFENNHSPDDWEKKVVSFITPKDFSTEATEYGKKMKHLLERYSSHRIQM
ncbi:hypothetical protein QAD02_015508 [Eretmocerus hayati]|uniref:Uncharacterized protein n=1 Tax=Eretmocerus hayati TaxID=131215 RepID=A0ACC2PA38_9HYME|nr:hypothetical protein QAD02_015508 [Eretmocerus hayati]